MQDISSKFSRHEQSDARILTKSLFMYETIVNVPNSFYIKHKLLN